jgi:hypothetical protein
MRFAIGLGLLVEGMCSNVTASVMLAGRGARDHAVGRLRPVCGVWPQSALGASIPIVEEKTTVDYHNMEGFSYLDDGFDGEDSWKTI